MPSFLLVFSASLLGTNDARADNANAAAWTIAERGPNHNVWKCVTASTNQNGALSYYTNRFTELATGLNYLQNGQWVDASNVIQLAQDGSGALATNTQHQVGFSANLNVTGAINVLLPSGNQLQSTVVGLRYQDDSTGNGAIIANITNSIGQLLPSLDEIIYTNALIGSDTPFYSDVVYTHRVNGIEQDIILRVQPPPPEQFGLNSSNTSLQIWTEFFNAPEPSITTNSTTVLAGEGRQTVYDEKLDFGSMRMGRGNAFTAGATNSSDIATYGMMLVPVAKKWIHSDGRTFLIEEVPFNAVAAQLSALPPPPSSTNAPSGSGGSQSSFRPLPSKELQAKTKLQPMRLAKGDLKKRPGFVMDYNLINTSVTNFVFQSDTTYYVQGTVNLYGTATFEGGTVLKLAVPNGMTVQEDDATWLTSQYRPAIFTCTNDNTVGVALPGASGTPNLANTSYLYCPYGGYVHDARFSYAASAYSGGSNDVEVWDCQFVDCNHPITVNTGTQTLGMHNVLIEMDTNINYTGNVGDFVGPFGLTVYSTDVHIYGENVTADLQTNRMIGFCYTVYPVSNCPISFTNSILLTPYLNPFYFSGSSVGITVGTNCTYYAASNPGTLFQNLGAGNYYLATDSPLLGTGTNNISAGLLADLAQKTTYPPIWVTNVLTNDTVFLPEVPRDTNALPTPGYHYPPIDFLVACVVSNATMMLSNGVVMAYYKNFAFVLFNSANVVSQGTPLNPDVFVHYRLVQEQASNIWSGESESAAVQNAMPLFYENNSTTGGNVLSLNFTTFSILNGEQYIFNCYQSSGGGYIPTTFSMQECELYCAGSTWAMDYTVLSNPVRFSNNLLHRAQPYFHIGTMAASLFNNNLAYCGQSNSSDGEIAFYWNGSGTSPNTNVNNAFYNNAVYLDGNYSNNAYLNGVSLEMSMGPNDITTNISWVTGPLGYYYQATNSPLANMGNTSASNLCLYHYTTHTNEVPQTNAIVDIGCHYVALGTNGLPLSTSGDGIGDYLKNSNGDGIYEPFVDLGNWTNSTTCAGGLNDYIRYLQGQNLNICTSYWDTNGILSLQVYTPLK